MEGPVVTDGRGRFIHVKSSRVHIFPPILGVVGYWSVLNVSLQERTTGSKTSLVWQGPNNHDSRTTSVTLDLFKIRDLFPVLRPSRKILIGKFKKFEREEPNGETIYPYNCGVGYPESPRPTEGVDQYYQEYLGDVTSIRNYNHESSDSLSCRSKYLSDLRPWPPPHVGERLPKTKNKLVCVTISVQLTDINEGHLYKVFCGTIAPGS